MTLQLLVSTQNSAFFARNYPLPFARYLIINQTDTSLPYATPEHTFNYAETGLSKSRNKAVIHATEAVCLICDDDIVFLPKAEAHVLQAFADNPTADVITFAAQTPTGKPWNAYATQQKWHNKRSIMRVSALEIAFKKQAITAAGLTFDERFGLGAEFATGEENIFLIDALNQGLKVLCLPIPIVIHPEQSSGSDLSNENLIRAKGAMFYRMFGAKAYVIGLLFAIKKTRLSTLGLFKFFQLMLLGIKQYKAHE